MHALWLFFDTVRRYLEYWGGYLVIYVQNFTDVDDKILKRAQEEEKEPLALAENYIQEYFGMLKLLMCKRLYFIRG